MNIPEAIINRFTQLEKLLDTRPPLERALMFTTGSLVIYMLVFIVLAAPLEKAGKSAQKEIEIKQAENTLLKIELKELTESLQQGPKESKVKRLKALKNELNNTAKLAELMEDLVPPAEIIQFVDGVLSSNNHITVVRAKNMQAVQLWPVPVSEESATDELQTEREAHSSQALHDDFTIYRHGMLIEVKGRYRELISFFSTLEQLPWKILWGNVNLKSDDTNDAVATLTIYTLSPEKVWMGL